MKSLAGVVLDLRYAIRALTRSFGFTLVAVVTLALGIGMTTAIFSAVYGVLLRPLPYKEPNRIVELHEVDARGHAMRFGDPNFADVRSQSRSFQTLAAYGDVVQPVSGGTQPTRADIAAVSRDFFAVLGVQPVLGRGFTAEDERPGTAPVALVSYGYWSRFLGAKTDLSADKLTIANRVVPVVGVLPPRFSFPSGAEIWLPRPIFAPYGGRKAHNWRVIGRLRAGISLSQARTELQTIAIRLKAQYGQDTDMSRVAVASLRDAMTSDVRQPLWTLLGAVGFLLLIACTNVANLLLVQSAARRRELGVRLTLGCSRWRLVRQSVTETLMLSLTGGLLGALAASWGLHTLLALSPNALPRPTSISLSLPVLSFSVGVCTLVAVVLGVFNSLRSSNGLQHALASAGRAQNGAVSERTSRLIVSGQLAMTLMLMTGAALLGHSLLRVLSMSPGFRTAHIATMNMALPPLPSRGGSGRGAAHRAQLLGELLTGIRAIPGVQDAGGANSLPFADPPADGTYVVLNDGEAAPRNIQQLSRMYHERSRTGHADYASVDRGYFKVLGIPLLRGRLFGAADTADTTHVAVISGSLAHERWPRQNPLGHRIEFGNMDGDLRPVTVVGVVGDVRQDSLEKDAFPTIYVDWAQRPRATVYFHVVMRASIATGALTAAARRVAHDLDPTVPATFSSMAEIVSGSLQSRRFNLMLVGIFAGTALLLATVGLYGVMAYSVTRRTNEIGIRMALGATEGSILSAMLRQSLLTAAIGIAVGVLASLAAARSIRSLLYGIGPMDPVSFAGVALLLLLVALAAGYVPARKATRVNPVAALRDE